MSQVHVAIPAYDELEFLPGTLENLNAQRLTPKRVWICINEPPHTETTNPEVHEANIETLSLLERNKHSYNFNLTILNGLGLSKGVGWARDFLALHIFEADPIGLTACLDADTQVEPDYIKSIEKGFHDYPTATGMALPYYHDLPADDLMARMLLRYEIYMRTYQLHLWQIESPYAYLALGSAMAYRNDAWKKVRGIPHRQAGEDFYFLQKLRKTGDLIRWTHTTVRPSSRSSKRVPFGTGMLLLEKDFELQQRRFPFFSPQSYLKIKETYDLWPNLYRSPCPLPIDDFLDHKGDGHKAFDRIRRNSTTVQQFMHNAHQYFDGLRTLQFLRFEYLKNIFEAERLPICFASDPLTALNDYRHQCIRRERAHQQEYMSKWSMGKRQGQALPLASTPMDGPSPNPA